MMVNGSFRETEDCDFKDGTFSHCFVLDDSRKFVGLQSGPHVQTARRE